MRKAVAKRQQTTVDESKTKELIENIHDNVSGLPYYMCEINGDLLLQRRVEEIPMDGTVGIFPANNMSEIYAKSWNSITGSIDTVIYKPALQEEVKMESKNNLDDLTE